MKFEKLKRIEVTLVENMMIDIEANINDSSCYQANRAKLERKMDFKFDKDEFYDELTREYKFNYPNIAKSYLFNIIESDLLEKLFPRSENASLTDDITNSDKFEGLSGTKLIKIYNGFTGLQILAFQFSRDMAANLLKMLILKMESHNDIMLLEDNLDLLVTMLMLIVINKDDSNLDNLVKYECEDIVNVLNEFKLFDKDDQKLIIQHITECSNWI